jgi:hypothetical protein
MDLRKQAGQIVGGALAGAPGARIGGELLSQESDAEYPKSHGFRNGIALVGVTALVASGVVFTLEHNGSNLGGIGVHESSPPVGNVQTKIQDIHLSGDTLLSIATGSADGSFGMQAQYCLPKLNLLVTEVGGQCADIPSLYVNAKSHIAGDENMIISAGDTATGYGVTLATQNIAGVENVVATVDASKIRFELANEATPRTLGDSGAAIKALELIGMNEVSLRDRTTGIARGTFKADCAVPLKKTAEAGIANTVRQTITQTEGLYAPNSSDSKQQKADKAATLLQLEDFLGHPVNVVVNGDIQMPTAPKTSNQNYTIETSYAPDTHIRTASTVQSGCDLTPAAAQQYADILKGEGTKYIIGNIAPAAATP